jgi:zinc protease
VTVIAAAGRAACAALICSTAISLTAQSSFASIQKRRLSNGLAVWIVEHHDVPIVQMSLVVPRGTGDDPPGRFGLASLVSAMLTEGAGSRTASDIAAAIDRLKGNLSPTGGVDASSVQLHVPVDGVADALPVFADVIMRPTFPEDALARLKQERLRVLRQAHDDPDAIASLALSRLIYGPSHRYGTALIGSAESVAAIARSDLQGLYTSWYRPAAATLLVAGDVVPDDMFKQIEAAFGSWQAPGPLPGAVLRPPAPSVSRRVVFIDVPGAPQSRLLAGGVGAPRSTADYFAMQVAQTLFRTRLAARLGESAAGVRAGFDMRKGAGPFVAAAAIRSDRTGDSLRELTATLTAMEQAVPNDELARAKSEVVARLPTFEATGRITARLQLLETQLVYELPDNYYSTYAASTEAVTAADVQRVARQYLSQGLVVVIAGDLASIESSVRAADSGPFARMTLDEVFGAAK